MDELPSFGEWVEVGERQRDCGRYGHAEDTSLVVMCENCHIMVYKGMLVRDVELHVMQRGCKHVFLKGEGLCVLCFAKRSQGV